MGRWLDPAEKTNAVQWVKALRDKLQPFAHGVYANQWAKRAKIWSGQRTFRTILAW
jgi:hypothetical protein